MLKWLEIVVLLQKFSDFSWCEKWHFQPKYRKKIVILMPFFHGMEGPKKQRM